MEGVSGFLESLHIDTPSSSSRFGRANTELAHSGAGSTAIVGAAYGGHTSVVEYLLSRGANMEQRQQPPTYSPFSGCISRTRVHCSVRIERWRKR